MQRMAGRSLDFPVTFKVRGTHSSVGATLLHLALGGCRLRTWRIMAGGETLTIDLPRQNGDLLPISGRVRDAVQVTPGSYEYVIAIDALAPAQEDILAREAAMLVQRRHSAA